MALSVRLLAVLTLLVASPAGAWTGLGHRIVAENAALLVSGDYGALLQRHRFELGIYAIQPDATFRRFDANESALHFLDFDKRPLTGWLNGPMPPPDDGRAPWRVEQMLRLARGEWAHVHQVSGGWQSGNAASGDIRHVFMALFYLGLLAHYTGDAAVPHHAISDRNGFAKGQGGVHYFFEGDCLDALEPELGPAALALARAQGAAWLAQWSKVGDTAVALTLALLEDSARRAPAVEAADRPFIVKPSQAGHMAQRKPAREACRAQRDLLTERLAKGATLTAELWRRALVRGIDWSNSRTLQLSDLPDGITSVPFE